MLLKVRIIMIISGLALALYDIFSSLMSYFGGDSSLQPQFTGKFVIGGLLFFFGIYIGKFKSKNPPRRRDTYGVADVNEEGPDYLADDATDGEDE